MVGKELLLFFLTVKYVCDLEEHRDELLVVNIAVTIKVCLSYQLLSDMAYD